LSFPTQQCIIGLDMHNIERLQTGEEAHLFMRTYRRANRVNMRPDLKAELVSRQLHGSC
jgi:hypothetical protein